MARTYWVIGGDYEDGDFIGIREGTHRVVGPFGDATRARTEWTRLTFRDNCPATERYHIAVEDKRVG